MTKQEFSKIAMAIRTYYPKEQLLSDRYAMDLWYEALNDLPYQLAHNALKKWVETNRWSPSISDIRGMCATFANGDFNSWEDEWQNVCEAIRKYGYMREEEALNSLPEITARIVVRMGYKNLCSSEKPSVDRANFRDIYNNTVTKEKEREKLSPRIRDAIDTATEKRYAIPESKLLKISTEKKDDSPAEYNEKISNLIRKTKEKLMGMG